MKAGLIGCGLNSDYHVNFSRRYPGLEIVGVVDKDEAKAQACAARHGIRNTYTNIPDLVREQKPDVLHIITPPPTHFAVAKQAIESKCHVLIEKPLALTAVEARGLYDLAEQNGVMLCAMHNHFFDPCMLKARELVQSGQVGRIIHVESHYGMNTRTDVFRKYPAPNVLPWLYSLPGGVFHDFMPHPLYVMLPFLGNVEQLEVMEKSFNEFPQNISDELRVLIKGEKAFGHLTFSFAAKPHHHFVRIHGTRMMINVDFNTMTTTTYPVSSLPKAAQKATYNLTGSWQLFSGTVANVWNFARKKLRPYQGMQTLIHGFYDAIAGRGEIPVSRKDGLQVIEVMDAIWPKITQKTLCFDPIISQGEGGGPLVLVTGASGFLGKRLVKMLLRDGYRVRALVRKLSNIEQLRMVGAEIFYGDVACEKSLEPAFSGVDYVVHAAADTGGSEEEGKISTIQGTKNILKFCRNAAVKRMVYISSCSVFGVADYKAGERVTEDSSLERFPERRGAYSLYKLEAEKIVSQAMAAGDVPCVCLRPGLIYGPGGEVFTPMMGFSLAELYVVIGDGTFVLPLTYVDNLCSVILTAMRREQSVGKTYNVVDPEQVTKREYMERLVKKLHPNAHTLYFPYSLLNFIVFCQEKIFQLLKRKPFLTRYRLKSSQNPVIFDPSMVMNDLGWQPPLAVQEAFAALLNSEKEKRG
ncbi:NAD-dependent epimerase/dehydratase family protein [Thiovibrio sp. JS02]